VPAPAAKSRRSSPRSPKPYLAPPVPVKGELASFVKAAELAGIELMPWQHLVGRYLTATTPNGWRYPEVAVIVPRQNGKTTLLLPRIVAGLLAGERIMHTAQNRELPREIYNTIAEIIPPDLMRHPPRIANGQERIDMHNGGVYRIVAPSRGGARGPTNDLVIIDELREFETFEFVAAAKPTLLVSSRPQMLYLSNAGSMESVVLNSLRDRAGSDDDLAYVEWSAPPEYAVDDRAGWKLANPRLAVEPTILTTLEREYRANLAAGTLAIFETEHLCRWVKSMQERFVSDSGWLACRGSITEEPRRPSIAFNMDPSGNRASIIMSWVLEDGRVAVSELLEALGDPIEVDRLGPDLKELVTRHRARQVSFASWTDQDLARHVPRAKALDGKEFCNASEHFARLVSQGRLVYDDAPHLSGDVSWATRKPHESGAWQAVGASPERSITAVLAAIRAVWLASAPRVLPRIG
jgi:phage terminase large subunit-like protein